jgi:hypothetical protein
MLQKKKKKKEKSFFSISCKFKVKEENKIKSIKSTSKVATNSQFFFVIKSS